MSERQIQHLQRFNQDLQKKSIDRIFYSPACGNQIFSYLEVHLKNGTCYTLDLPEPLGIHWMQRCSECGIDTKLKKSFFSLNWRELPWSLLRWLLFFFISLFSISIAWSMFSIHLHKSFVHFQISNTQESVSEALHSEEFEEEMEAIKNFIHEPSENPIKFNDLYGNQEAKEELGDFLSWLKNPDYFKSKGIKPPLGILLHGAPGNGKTMMAKALAGECNIPFIALSGSYFDEVFVGVGSKRIKALFEVARQKAPCVVFIDEIDCLAPKRNNSKNAYSRMTINQLLSEMDGFNKASKQEKPVLILAATNMPDLLDPAIRRPGRFDRETAIVSPNLQDRKLFIQETVKRRGIPLSSDVELNEIAHWTFGQSFAWIVDCINEAALSSVARKDVSVNMEDFMQAFVRIKNGSRSDATLSPTSKARMARQVAAESLIGWKLMNKAARPLMASTQATTEGWGVVQFIPTSEQGYCAMPMLRNMICINLARSCAASMDPAHQGLPDKKEIDNLFKAKILALQYFSFQMDNSFRSAFLLELNEGKEQMAEVMSKLPEKTKQALEQSIAQLLNEEWQRCMTILKEEEASLKIVQERLLQKNQVGRDEMKIIFGE